ncbi:MAG: hypothetical protein ACK5XN_06445 [Bacteroidota bacterium]
MMASDSNLTSRKGNSGFGQKVFPVPYLNAGVAYSGLYEIGGQDIDDWMNEFINDESFIKGSIEDFVQNLTKRLNADFKGSLTDMAIIHICGYSKYNFVTHCEHWHISNSSLDKKTGNYSRNERFEYHIDFNSRTSKENLHLLKSFDIHPNNNQFFINGFPPARISFMAIKKQLEDIIVQITNREKWSFRPPKNLFETSNYIKIYFSIIGELFKMSDHEALFVGGETQTYLIPAPSDLIKE